jgi:RNA polymerase sigma factor (sigma-70 family)
MDGVDDAELMARARAGDGGAFTALVRPYVADAIRLAYVITGSNSLAEEATQEGFVRAYSALPRFDTDRPLRPWLLRIVANEAKNRRRSAGRRGRLTAVVAGRRPEHQPTPEDVAITDADSRAVLAALAGLADRDRDVISCRYFAGLSERDTAEVLGCKTGTVKSRLNRALERLRVALGDSVGLEVGDA